MGSRYTPVPQPGLYHLTNTNQSISSILLMSWKRLSDLIRLLPVNKISTWIWNPSTVTMCQTVSTLYTFCSDQKHETIRCRDRRCNSIISNTVLDYEGCCSEECCMEALMIPTPTRKSQVQAWLEEHSVCGQRIPHYDDDHPERYADSQRWRHRWAPTRRSSD